MKSTKRHKCLVCDSIMNTPNLNRCKVCLDCDSKMIHFEGSNYEALGKRKSVTIKAGAMIRGAKSRGKAEVNLEVEDVIRVWPRDGKCPILGVELTCGEGSKSKKRFAPNLDRIDPTKGYQPDNIQILSALANRMKQDASDNELLLFAQWIKETYNG